MKLTIAGSFDSRTRRWVDPTGMFTVKFPSGSTFIYKTLTRASIGRVYADALRNVPRINRRSTKGWADLARATGIFDPDYKKKKGVFSSNISFRVYSWASAGILPKDAEQRAKLIALAGKWAEIYKHGVDFESK